MNTLPRLLFLAAGLAFSLATAWSQTTIFTATLTGGQEVPANGSSGTGSGTLEINNTSRAWTLSGTFSGLSGTANNAHIHGPAAVGVGAGVVVGISFTSGTSGTISGTGTFTSGQASDLFAGLYYINIHSTVESGGEIRGQLTAIPEPSSYAMIVGLLGLGIAFQRQRKVLKAQN